MNDKFDKLIDVLTSIDKKLDIVSKNITQIRSADAIRNLALSNFVSQQESINSNHSKSIESLTKCFDRWFEAEGRFKNVIKN